MAGPQNAYHEIEDADLTDIRFLEVEHKITLKPLHEFTLHPGKIGDGKTVMRFDFVATIFLAG